MNNLPEYLLYAITMIQPNFTNGGVYGISVGSEIEPFLPELMSDNDIKIIMVGPNSYIIEMDQDKFFEYIAQGLNQPVYNKDKEEFIFKPKVKESIVLDLYLQKHRGEVQTIGIYSCNESNGIVKNGISYLGLHLTYEEILPLLEKYNCVVKVGSAAVPPKEVLNHLYNDKSIGQCFECNRTNTGCLLTIKIGA